MPRTRILSTIGPASSELSVISALMAAGADAFRLNFSHGTVATHQEMCRRIRQAAQEARRDVAIVQDLGGPKIRIGELAAPLRLEAGAALVIDRGDEANEPAHVSCGFDALFTSVAPGHRLLV